VGSDRKQIKDKEMDATCSIPGRGAKRSIVQNFCHKMRREEIRWETGIDARDENMD
jgi:hypothetical protein